MLTSITSSLKSEFFERTRRMGPPALEDVPSCMLPVRVSMLASDTVLEVVDSTPKEWRLLVTSWCIS